MFRVSQCLQGLYTTWHGYTKNLAAAVAGRSFCWLNQHKADWQTQAAKVKNHKEQTRCVYKASKRPRYLWVLSGVRSSSSGAPLFSSPLPGRKAAFLRLVHQASRRATSPSCKGRLRKEIFCDSATHVSTHETPVRSPLKRDLGGGSDVPN